MFKVKFSSSKNDFNPEFNNFQTIKGEDGFSPVINIQKEENGHIVDITDKEGTKSFEITNGEDGYTPIKGADYFTDSEKQEFVNEILEKMPTQVTSWNKLNDKPPELDLIESGDKAKWDKVVDDVAILNGDYQTPGSIASIAHSLGMTDYELNKRIDEKVTTVNGVTPDESGNVNVSWNDLEDRPFGDFSNINLVASGGGTIDDDTGSTTFSATLEFTPIANQTYKIVARSATQTLETVGDCFITDMAAMGMYIAKIGGSSGPLSLACMTKGSNRWSVMFSLAPVEKDWTVEVYEYSENVVTLNEKYIPDTIARVEYVDGKVITDNQKIILDFLAQNIGTSNLIFGTDINGNLVAMTIESLSAKIMAELPAAEEGEF